MIFIYGCSLRCGSQREPRDPRQLHPALYLPQTVKSRKNPLSPSSLPRLPSQGKRNWNLFTEATVSSLFQFPSKIDGLVFLLSSQLPSPWGHLAAASIHCKAGRQRKRTFLKQSLLNPLKSGGPAGGISVSNSEGPKFNCCHDSKETEPKW